MASVLKVFLCLVLCGLGAKGKVSFLLWILYTTINFFTLTKTKRLSNAELSAEET